MQSVLSRENCTIRRPKLTATLVALLRRIWQNIISIPQSPSLADPSHGEEPSVWANALVQDIIDCGIIKFFMIECLRIYADMPRFDTPSTNQIDKQQHNLRNIG